MNTRFDPRDAGTNAARHPDPIGAAPVEETATDARQGVLGKPVLMVLVGGLVLAMLAWGGAEWWGEATDPPAEQTATPPAGSNQPGNASGAAPSNAPVMPAPPAPNNAPTGNQGN